MSRSPRGVSIHYTERTPRYTHGDRLTADRTSTQTSGGPRQHWTGDFGRPRWHRIQCLRSERRPWLRPNRNNGRPAAEPQELASCGAVHVDCQNLGMRMYASCVTHTKGDSRDIIASYLFAKSLRTRFNRALTKFRE